MLAMPLSKRTVKSTLATNSESGRPVSIGPRPLYTRPKSITSPIQSLFTRIWLSRAEYFAMISCVDSYSEKAFVAGLSCRVSESIRGKSWVLSSLSFPRSSMDCLAPSSLLLLLFAMLVSVSGILDDCICCRSDNNDGKTPLTGEILLKDPSSKTLDEVLEQYVTSTYDHLLHTWRQCFIPFPLHI